MNERSPSSLEERSRALFLESVAGLHRILLFHHQTSPNCSRSACTARE